jgi:predicted TIM-barrel fold metal-dependent hydrolase
MEFMSQQKDSSTSRRGFLKQTGAAVAAASCGVAGVLHTIAAATPKDRRDMETVPMLPIIDTHQHLWDLGKFKLPWIKEGSPLARSYLTADYLKATAGLNVVKSVYMEVDVEPSQQAAEAEYVIDICKNGKTPMVAAIISGRPNSEGFKDYITRFKDSRYIKGVRQVLHGPDTPAGYCLDEKFIQGIRLLGDMGLSFDLCLRGDELLDGAKLIDACSGTRFILDHCGNADVQARDHSAWQRGLSAVAQRKNVVVKVSGIVASAKPGAWSADDLAPIISHTVAAFGHDRVMFGGDWPVCTLAATYKQWVEALKSIVRSWKEEDQRKLFHDNAAKFYGIG